MELISEGAAARMKEKGKYLVAFSLEGVNEAVERQAAEIAEIGKKEGAAGSRVFRGQEDRAFWLGIRNFALAAQTPVVLKSNFVISKQAEILESYEKHAQAAGIDCAFIGHAGNGILMTYVLGSEVAQPDRLADLIAKFTAEAVQKEGNLVVESCPTELKGKIEVWGQLRTDAMVMRRLKEKMDPAAVLNPGRFVGGI